MDPTLTRIDEWQQVGLLDEATADRLRAAERERSRADASGPAEPVDRRPRLSLSAVFGPGVSVGEMFAYLGVGFLLASWTAFVARLAGNSGGAGSTIGFGFAIAAGFLILIGFVFRNGSVRRRRAAGVALLLALGYVAAAITAFIAPGLSDGVTLYAIVAACTLFVSVVLRMLHPALSTQIGFLAWATAFAGAVLALIQRQLVPVSALGLGFNSDADRFPSVIASAVVWLLAGLVLGFVAVAEDRIADDADADPGEAAAAARRATVTRAWAGLVAVAGLASALTQTQFRNQEFGRVIPAWIAEIAILALAIVLVERAFRRDSGAFLIAAGIGFIIALTDFNFTYLTSSTDVGLLVEGVILLAVGFGADRLRRRLSDRPDGRGSGATDDTSGAPHEPAPVAAPQPAVEPPFGT